MANSKFSFFPSFEEALIDVPGEEFKETILMICGYAFRGEIPEKMTPAQKMFFAMAKPLIKRGQVSAENGKTGGRPPKEEKNNLSDKNENLGEKENNLDEKNENLQVIENKPSENLGSVPPEMDMDMEEDMDMDMDYCSALKQVEDEAVADVEAIPLNDGTEWKPKVDVYKEYCRLYPNVDVEDAFRRMRAWCLSNSKNRKTRRGVTKFVNGWLARDQDKPRNANYSQSRDAPDDGKKWDRSDEREEYDDENLPFS